MSLRYVTANSKSATLQDGAGLTGTSQNDRAARAFGEIYNGKVYFVAWNGRFLTSPTIHKPGLCWAAWSSPPVGIAGDLEDRPGPSGAAHPRCGACRRSLILCPGREADAAHRARPPAVGPFGTSKYFSPVRRAL